MSSVKKPALKLLFASSHHFYSLPCCCQCKK